MRVEPADPERITRSRLLTAGTLAAAALLVAIIVSRDAWQTLGMPFPGLLVDPYGVYSDVHLASWEDAAVPLRHPDRLVSVDGIAIGDAIRYGNFPLTRLTRLLSAAPRTAGGVVDLVFSREGEQIAVQRPLRTIGGEEIIFLFGLYTLVGVFVLWSGLLVFLVAGRRPAATAYATLAAASFLFLLTLLDYHTRATFAPLFNASMMATGIGCAWLSLVFPEPPRSAARATRVFFRLFVAASVVAVAWIVMAPLLSRDSFWARSMVDALFRASLLAVAVSMLVRIRRSRDHQRAELVSALPGLVLAPAMIVVGLLARGKLFYLLLLPCMISLLPLSVGYALVRHNILASTLVLTRRMFVFPVALGACVVAAVVWRVVSHSFEGAQASAIFPGATAVTVFGLVFATTRRGADRIFFPATAQFRPTIEVLTDELGATKDEGSLQRAMETTVARWLPTTSVRLVEGAALGELAPLPSRGIDRLNAGELLWTAEPVSRRRLLVPMRSLGELRGVIDLAPKRQGALFTSADLTLLQTIAGLGAVAMHNARNLTRLEELRRFEALAAKDEKQQALAVLGAEVSHEIAYSLNYFRYLLKDGRAVTVDVQDVAIGREEVERLERMVNTLQRLQLPPLQLRRIAVAPVVARALGLLRGQLEEQGIQVDVAVSETLQVAAAPDPLLQVFANLLRNAAQAAGMNGSIGVRTLKAEGRLALEVWDDGPGIPDSERDEIFKPWVSHRAGGLGLGLAVTQRLVRAFGWSIALAREGERTCFRLLTPHSDSLREDS